MNFRDKTRMFNFYQNNNDLFSPIDRQEYTDSFRGIFFGFICPEKYHFHLAKEHGTFELTPVSFLSYQNGH